MCFVFVFCPLFLFFVDCPNGGMPFTSIPHPPLLFSSPHFNYLPLRKKAKTAALHRKHFVMTCFAHWTCKWSCQPPVRCRPLSVIIDCFLFSLYFLKLHLFLSLFFFSFFRTLLFIGRFFLKQFTVSVIYTYCNREIIFFFSLPLS